MIFIAPYRMAFPTARRIREVLPNSRIIKYRNSRFNWNRSRGTVLNWGRSDIPPTNRQVINQPHAISVAANKRRFLAGCEENNIPAPRLLSEDQCISTLEEGKVLLIRTPSSFGGKGIKVVRGTEEFHGIPLNHMAVQFFPKETEFRAHVWGDEIIFLTQKRSKRGVERERDQKLVWSHSNGYVHCRQDVECPDGLEELAIKSVKMCGLHFGAVDIMLNKDGVLRVLEVNTAPGLTGQVLDKYLEVIREI